MRDPALAGDTQDGDETVKPWLLQELIDDGTERWGKRAVATVAITIACCCFSAVNVIIAFIRTRQTCWIVHDVTFREH